MRILTIVILWGVTLWGGSGYDHGTAAGKGNLDLAITWNPLNYFEDGQSYVVLGYGLTDRIDIHGYYSEPVNNNDNYYFGLFYQFFGTNRLDLATAIGMRKFTRSTTVHLFIPQLLYTVKLGGGDMKLGEVLWDWCVQAYTLDTSLG